MTRERVMPSRIMTRYSDVGVEGMMGRNYTYRIYRPQGRSEANEVAKKKGQRHHKNEATAQLSGEGHGGVA